MRKILTSWSCYAVAVSLSTPQVKASAEQKKLWFIPWKLSQLILVKWTNSVEENNKVDWGENKE